MVSPQDEFDIGLEQAIERLRQPGVDSFFVEVIMDPPEDGFRHEFEYNHNTDDPEALDIRNRRLIGMFLKTYADELDMEVEEVAEMGVEAADDIHDLD